MAGRKARTGSNAVLGAVARVGEAGREGAGEGMGEGSERTGVGAGAAVIGSGEDERDTGGEGMGVGGLWALGYRPGAIERCTEDILSKMGSSSDGPLEDGPCMLKERGQRA